MADTRPVLVAGASGYLGGYLVRELLRRGIAVRALVRSATKAAAGELAAAGADVVARDAAQPGTLVGVCDGCRAVASCLAADMYWRSGTPESIDRDANIALFQEAAASAAASSSGGVQHFMLVATYEGREAQKEVPLQRAKEAAVDFIEQLAGDYGLTYTIIRPTAYFKDFTDHPWKCMQASNWMLVPGGGYSRYNPIDGAELARFMADCLLDPGQWANQEVRIGGPEVLTFRDTIYAAAEAAGKRRDQVWLLPLPPLLLRVAAMVFGLLSVLWSPAKHIAGALRFGLYSSTHDSVGMRYGSRTVADHYRDLRQQQMLEQQQGQQGQQPPLQKVD